MKPRAPKLVICFAVVIACSLLLTAVQYSPGQYESTVAQTENTQEPYPQNTPITYTETEENVNPTKIDTLDDDIITQHRQQTLYHAVVLDKLVSTGRQGTKGRLVLNNFGFSVAVYESDQYNGPDAQAIVDAADSAVWFMWFECQSPIIADHCNQGFDVIKECSVGDICYIVDGDDFQKYVCVDVDDAGINERDNMYLSSGYNFMRENDPGYLYMYTCNKEGDPYNITVVTWTPVED